MAHRYDHLREKAIKLRTEQHLTLEEIIERLALPKGTVYYWIKDLPIPWTERQTEAQREKADIVRKKYAALRDAAYQQGAAEAPELMKDLSFRDFVVLYMAEGYKRSRNCVAFVNSDPAMVKLAHRWITLFSARKMQYNLQYHADHDVQELKLFWAGQLGIPTECIRETRKSNSGQLGRRNFRSQHGLLTVRTGDTYLRSRLQAWMDFIKTQW